MIDVLACREGDDRYWVVSALDPDLASQSNWSLLHALEDLGRMFDLCDAREPGIAGPSGPAPVAYRTAFTIGREIGLLPLGRARVARVRIGVSPYARTVEP